MQDFANCRTNTDLEASRAYSATWSPDIPSLVIGILLGVAACLAGLKVAQNKADQIVFIETLAIAEEIDVPFVFEFYEILKNR
jgi:hypothetical protein